MYFLCPKGIINLKGVMKMSEINGLKIFICLIFTVAAVILWISVQCSMAADVSHTQYEGAVFVDHEAGYLYQAG